MNKYVIHIPSGCCYPLEEDGCTVIIRSAHLQPEIDGKFWERVDTYTAKDIRNSNPFGNS